MINNLVISVGETKTIKTIVEAVKKATDEILINPDVIVTIKIDGGNYLFEEPIELTPKHNNIKFVAATGENVTFTGSKCYSNLKWEDCEHNQKIKCAFVEKGLNVDMLFVNSETKILARYPNYCEGVLPLGGATDETTIKERSKLWKTPETGYIRALHSNGWGSNSYIIEGFDETTAIGLNLRWVGDNNRGDDYMKDAIVVENVFEELDTVGEWFYNKNTGMLYYYPEKEISVDDIFELAVNTKCFHLQGESVEKPIKNITFSGIKFENTKRTLFAIDEPGNTFIPLMRGDWAVVPSGAIYIENGEAITVNNCDFRNMGSNGIFMYNYNNLHNVSGCTFKNIGASAVQIVGNSSAVDDPSFWEHALHKDIQVHATTVKNPHHVGPVSEQYPRDIVVTDCLMTDIGIFEKQSAGVSISVASRIKVLHNTIHKSARSNINVNDGSFGGHEIAYNDIYDAQRETLDHGPFNSWGRDRFWSVPRYNASGESGDILRNYTNDGVNFYDVTGLDAYQTTTIHDNRFHHAKDAPHTWGIDLDDGSSNYSIYNNLCLGLGIKLREGFDRRVYNNILISGNLEIHVPYTAARDQFYCNIVISGHPINEINVDSDRYKKTEYIIDKNCYYNFGESMAFPDWHKDEVDKNALFDQNPEFKNPEENDYTVCNEDVLKKIGFVNFDMTRFGRRGEKQPPSFPFELDLSQIKTLAQAEWEGAKISEIDDAIISSTASTGKAGVYFADVPENSNAYKIGFRTRDIVKSIEGKTTYGFHDFFGFVVHDCKPVATFTIHRTNDLNDYTFNLSMSKE